MGTTHESKFESPSFFQRLKGMLGGIVAGFLAGTSFAVSVGSLILAIASKIVMSLSWASLYTFLNIIFRRYFGVSIASSFFFGTGILIIGVRILSKCDVY